MNKKNAALLSVVSNSILIIFKAIAGIMMGSVSVISEAIHSAIDLLASLIAFFSIRKASKESDEDHPFGHGKYENVSGFVEAILILIAAVLIIYEAIKRIIYGGDVENLGAGIIVMLVAALVNLCISIALFKIAKKSDSIALEADAMHLLTDVFTSLGVFAGLVLIKFTGWKILDAITALFVAVLIIKASTDLIKKSLADLVDERLPDEDIAVITEIINANSEIITYHNLRTRKSGDTREIDVRIHVNKNESIAEVHSLCDKIEEEIQIYFSGKCYVVIHPEPDEIQ